MKKLSVVIPAWNEQGAIAQVVERTLAVRDALRLEAGIAELEILIVDDGSTDDTARIVDQLAASRQDGKVRIRSLHHTANRGYGAALQSGLTEATGDLLAFLDADCTYPPEQLPALCRPFRKPGLDMVVGDRMTGPGSRMPALRRLGNLFFAFLVNGLTGAQIADCSSGMRVLPAVTWEKLGALPTGLDFTPAMTVRALRHGLVVHEVPIPYSERVGSSKLHIVRDGLRFLATILREARAAQPRDVWAPWEGSSAGPF